MATLDFKGKALVQNFHLSVKYHELVPKKDKSLTDKVRLDDNLIIHGDNLKALKALLPSYAGQVKCIYIDPPYNTGSEGWAYNDNVNSPMMQEWLGKVVDISTAMVSMKFSSPKTSSINFFRLAASWSSMLAKITPSFDRSS